LVNAGKVLPNMGRPKTIKPRPYGTGTVDRLANGTYRGRVTIDGVRETVYHGTDPDECGRLLDDLLDGIRPDDPAPDGVTFKAWLDTWHDDYADADANTLDGYRNEIALLQPLHGHVVTDLEVKDFDRLLKALAKDGYARTVHRYKKAGHYLVRVERTDHRGHTAIGHLQVRVGEENGLLEKP